jgi:hypothetical protein
MLRRRRASKSKAGLAMLRNLRPAWVAHKRASVPAAIWQSNKGRGASRRGSAEGLPSRAPPLGGGRTGKLRLQKLEPIPKGIGDVESRISGKTGIAFWLEPGGAQRRFEGIEIVDA